MPRGAPCLWRSSCWPPLPCPPQFLPLEHLCITQPARSLCCPMSLGFCVASPSLIVVSSGTCFLSPTACAGLECLVLLILTHHKASSSDLSLVAAPSEQLAERCSPAVNGLDSPLATMLWSLSCDPQRARRQESSEVCCYRTCSYNCKGPEVPWTPCFND